MIWVARAWIVVGCVWAFWVPAAITVIVVDPQHWPWGTPLPDWSPLLILGVPMLAGALTGSLLSRKVRDW